MNLNELEKQLEDEMSELISKLDQKMNKKQEINLKCRIAYICGKLNMLEELK